MDWIDDLIYRILAFWYGWESDEPDEKGRPPP